MANSPKRTDPQRPAAQRPAAQRPAAQRGGQPAQAPKRTTLWIVIGVAAVVLVAAVVAIVSAGGDADSGEADAPVTCEPVTLEASPASDSADGEVWPVTITGGGLPTMPDSGADPCIGATAPTVAGSTFDGSAVSVDPSKGPVMLVFLAHWCPHCNREAPELMQWKADGGVPEGLQVIGVTTAVDDRRDFYPPSTWINEQMGWTWPVLADSASSEVFRAMGGSGFPYVVILDTDGTVLDRWSGELGEAGIQARVDAALA